MYPNIKFPGTHYTHSDGDENGFTFAELIDENESFRNKIFIGKPRNAIGTVAALQKYASFPLRFFQSLLI